MDKSERAALAQGEAQPVAWRDHVEQRIWSWKQRTMNRSGDHLAIGDFMGASDIDDLVDYVCDEYAEPPAPPPPAAPCPHIRSSGMTHWCSLAESQPKPSTAQSDL